MVNEEARPDESKQPDEPRDLPPWIVPLLIGLVTITAGVFTWRAGQLGSSAAYQDRQSVSQTITQQQQDTEAGLKTVNDAVNYIGYAADFAQAAAVDDLAQEADDQGEANAAQDLRTQAQELRDSASAEVVAVGVFGTQQVLTQSATDPTMPIPFSTQEQLLTNSADVSTGITSPGVLDPNGWAAKADDTRERVRGLRLYAFFLVGAAVAYTIAELAPRRWVRRIGFGVGSVVYAFVAITGFITVF